MSKKTNASGKIKSRISIADILITLAAIICLVVCAAELFTAAGVRLGRNDRVVTLCLSDLEAACYGASGETQRKGAAVFDTESGREVGRLYADFRAGDKTMVVRVDAENTQDAMFCGDRVSVYTGNIVLTDAVVTDSRKAADYGKK